MSTSVSLPRIAVVTVVWNDVRHIEATLASVREQTWAQLDHIVIDGGSTDGTAAVIEGYRRGLAAFVSEPDRGLYDAMNKGLALCRPDTWVYFLNSGDVFAGPDALARTFCGRHFGGRSGGDSAGWPALVLAPVIKRGATDELQPVRPGRKLGMPACHQGIFCRQPLLARHGFDLRYGLAADYDLYLKVARDLAPGEVGVAGAPVAIVSAGGLSDRRAQQVTREYCAIMWRQRKWGALAVYAARRSVRHTIEAGVRMTARLSTRPAA
jgi:glycosyltransferase involved in cell wall biosynthesis